jgi:uroporphyrinogen-III synthase
MTVLLTRTVKDSENLAKQLESFDISTYIEPMFNIEYLDYDLSSVELSSSQAVIFTSKNAINAIRNNVQKFIHLKCFVIGNATAKLAKKLKFNNIYVANNNAKSLANLILKEIIIKDGKLLYFCGELITLDFKKELEKYGYNVHRFCVYKTVPINDFSKNLKNKIISNKIKIILLYSFNTAAIFLDLIKKNNMLEFLSGINLMVISKKVKLLAEVNNWKSVSIFDIDQPKTITKKIRYYYETSK